MTETKLMPHKWYYPIKSQECCANCGLWRTKYNQDDACKHAPPPPTDEVPGMCPICHNKTRLTPCPACNQPPTSAAQDDVTLVKRIWASMKADIVSIYGTSYMSAWNQTIEVGEEAFNRILGRVK